MRTSWIAMFMLFLSCNIDYKNPEGVSVSIDEAKEMGVFITEYKIVNIVTYDSTILFPIDNIWLEKSWNFILNEKGDEVCNIKDTVPYKVVFSLKPNSALNEDNLLQKWIIQGQNQWLSGLTRGKIFIYLDDNVIPDELTFRINQLGKEYDYKNNLKFIAQFKAVRR